MRRLKSLFNPQLRAIVSSVGLPLLLFIVLLALTFSLLGLNQTINLRSKAVDTREDAVDVNRPFYRLQREILRLLVLVQSDKENFSVRAFDLQYDLVDNSFYLLSTRNNLNRMNKTVREIYDAAIVQWNTIIPDLATWRQNPQNTPLQSSLIKEIRVLEEIVNREDSAYATQVGRINEDLIKAESDLSQSIIESVILLVSFILLVVLNIYYANHQLRRAQRSSEYTLRALERSEEHFRMVLDSSPEPIVTYDLDGLATYINPAFSRTFGWIPEELIGKRIDFIPVHQKSEASEAFKRLFKDGRVISFETQRFTKSGQVLDIQMSASVFRDSENRPTGSITILQDITERRENLRLLQESEGRLRAVIETTPIPISISHQETGKLLFANNAHLEIFGSKQPSVIDLLGNSIYYDQNSDLSTQTIIAKGGVLNNFEVHLKRVDGEDIWALVSAKAISYNGEAAILASFYDITSRKQVEKELAESRRLAQSITDTIPNIIYIFDLVEKRYVYINRGLAGYSVQEINELGENLLATVMHPDDLAHLPTMIKRITNAKDNEIYEREYRIFHKNGKVHWLYDRTIVFSRTPDGRVKQFLGTALDLTERKNTEEKLWRQRNYLKALHNTALALLNRLDTNDLLTSILEHTKEMINTDTSTIFLETDDKKMIEHIAGIGVSRGLIGQKLKPGEGLCGLVWQTGEIIVVNDYANWPNRLPIEEYDTGKYTVGLPIRIGEKVVGAMSISSKQADRVFTEEEIELMSQFGQLVSVAIDNAQLFSNARQSREEAEQASRAKSVFLANMSHELRTPLNAILGFAQLLERDKDLNQTQRNHLAIISRSGEHLLNLINDVLEVSKIEAGHTILHQHPFDLYRLLINIQEMLYVRAENKNLQFSVMQADDLPQYVVTDESKLRQVLINLIGNAIKFTHKGSVVLRVNYKDATLLFEVEDTGPGIAETEMKDLFDPFIQTSSGKKSFEGTGLGLTISRQYIELMGGNISVESKVGKGSIFRFEINVTLTDSSEVEGRLETRRVIGMEPDQPIYRMLIIEDKWTNRVLLRNLLQPLGFEIYEANNGQEGIEAWEQWQPHLIWMDMRMPVMDGYEATRQIKSTENGKDTVIIALTASAFEHERTAILAAGCDDFVRKPFREGVIFEKIAQHLGVRFMYEDTVSQDQATAKQVWERKDLAPLPIEWRLKLYNAASIADFQAALSIIEEIKETHSELALYMGELVNGFRFDTVMMLTKEGEL